MKTIIHVHILIRLCASFCIIYGLYSAIIAWPQLATLNDLIEKQKENALLHGRDFELGAFIPTYAEFLLAPILIFTAGIFAFVGTKKIVELIIGRKQINALIDSERKGAQIQPR